MSRTHKNGVGVRDGGRRNVQWLKSISFKNDLKKSEATKIYMILPRSIVIVLICSTTYKAIFKGI